MRLDEREPVLHNGLGIAAAPEALYAPELAKPAVCHAPKRKGLRARGREMGRGGGVGKEEEDRERCMAPREFLSALKLGVLRFRRFIGA